MWAHLMIRSQILALLSTIRPWILLFDGSCKLFHGLDHADLVFEWLRLIDSALWVYLRPQLYFEAPPFDDL